MTDTPLTDEAWTQLLKRHGMDASRPEAVIAAGMLNLCRIFERKKLSVPPEARDTLTEVLRRCAEYHGDDALLDAPCVFCGYNGAGYWQKGSHAKHCRWHQVGGFEDRRKALQRDGCPRGGRSLPQKSSA